MQHDALALFVSAIAATATGKQSQKKCVQHTFFLSNVTTPSLIATTSANLAVSWCHNVSDARSGISRPIGVSKYLVFPSFHAR